MVKPQQRKVTKKVVYEVDATATSKMIGQDNVLSVEEIEKDFFEIVSHKHSIIWILL